MFSPAVLLVFVLSPDATEPTTPSFQAAAREVLGPYAAVRVEALTEALPDAAALELGGTAEGIVELIWSPARDRVLVHCYIRSQRRWVDRAIVFARQDLERERGRLLGFAVASMFSDAPSFAPRPAQQQEADRAGVEPELPQPSLPTPPRFVEDTRSAPSWSTPASSSASAQQPLQRSLEFSAVAVPDVGGSLGPEFGASGALRSAIGESLWWRVELSGRLGEVPAAQANLRRVLAGVGIAWDALAAPSAVHLGLRADLLGSWLQVAHLSSDDVERVHLERWLLGSDAILTAGYGISSSAAIYAGLGVEAMFGRTYVYTHGTQVAVVPLLRSRLELGFRSDF
jgi:hypothetical protein